MSASAASRNLAASPLAILTWSLAAAAAVAAPSGAGGKAPSQAPPRAYRISGPYAHENLVVFLLHGKDRVSSRSLLTLQEALARKAIVVHETGNVNQLAVENVSAEADVFIHSGDIVKGGRQDRMLQQDLIVAPRSGRVPIASFCVEQGRWRPRGAEPASAFSSADELAVGKAMKIAARRKEDQREVWSAVASAQEGLAERVGHVPSTLSPSSLQLTLEDRKVRDAAERYVAALTRAPRRAEDALGVAFVIDGKVGSVDVYASHDLFTRLWPKLLRAAAVEALSARPVKPAGPRLAAADLHAWLADAEQAGAERKELTDRVSLVTRESPRSLLFETRDRARKDEWIHRSYVAK
jgi:hypothetical protein